MVLKILTLLSLCFVVVSAKCSQLVDSEITKQINLGPNFYTVGYDFYKANTTTNKYFPITTSMKDTSYSATMIQTALTSLGANGGGILYIMKGTYIIDKNIYMVPNTRICGDGIDKTILKLVKNAKQFKQAGFFRIYGGDGLIISDITLHGNKENQKKDSKVSHDPSNISYGKYGLYTEATKNLWLHKVKITNFQGYGFDPHGDKDMGIYGQYLTISNCIAEYNDWDGFTIDQTYNSFLFDNMANNNGRHGYNIVTGTKHFTISNCTSNNNGYYDPYGGSGCGYMIQNNQNFGTSSGIVEKNYADNNKKGALCLNDVYDIKITQNDFTGGTFCLNLENARDTIVSSNKCTTRKYYNAVNTVVTSQLNTYDPNTQVLVKDDNIFTVNQ